MLKVPDNIIGSKKGKSEVGLVLQATTPIVAVTFPLPNPSPNTDFDNKTGLRLLGGGREKNCTATR